MTLPERFFCSIHAVHGKAIHMGRPFTSKRTSTASAWRVAIATTLAFQRQTSSSPVHRSVTLKSSYIVLAYRSAWIRASSQVHVRLECNYAQGGGRSSLRADKLIRLQS